MCCFNSTLREKIVFKECPTKASSVVASVTQQSKHTATGRIHTRLKQLPINSSYDETLTLKVTWRQNEDKYKNLSWQNLHCLGASQFIVSLLITCILAEEMSLKLAITELPDLSDLDLRSVHMAYRLVSLIDLYLHIKFCSNRKNFLWTNGWIVTQRPMSNEDGFIRSAGRSRPKTILSKPLHTVSVFIHFHLEWPWVYQQWLCYKHTEVLSIMISLYHLIMIKITGNRKWTWTRH